MEEVPQSAPAPEAESGNSRPVTATFSPHVVDSLQHTAVSIMETLPIRHEPTQPVMSHQLGPQPPPPVLHTNNMPKQEKLPEDIFYKQVEVVEPGGGGQIRVNYTGGKPHLIPLSQQVHGKMKVQRVNWFSPLDVDLLLDNVSGVTTISGGLVANKQRERPSIELAWCPHSDDAMGLISKHPRFI